MMTCLKRLVDGVQLEDRKVVSCSYSSASNFVRSCWLTVLKNTWKLSYCQFTGGLNIHDLSKCQLYNWTIHLLKWSIHKKIVKKFNSIAHVLVFEFEKIKQIKFNQFSLRGQGFTSRFRIAFYIRENLDERTLQNQIWCAFPTRTNGPWRLLLIYRVRLAGGAAGAGLNLHWNRICFHVVVAAVKVRSDFSDLSGAHTVIDNTVIIT